MRESVTDFSSGSEALLSLPEARAAGLAAATLASMSALRVRVAGGSAARVFSSHHATYHVTVSCACRYLAGSRRCSSRSAATRDARVRGAGDRAPSWTRSTAALAALERCACVSGDRSHRSPNIGQGALRDVNFSSIVRTYPLPPYRCLARLYPSQPRWLEGRHSRQAAGQRWATRRVGA